MLSSVSGKGLDVSKVISVVPLALEAAILAAVVAGLAAMQSPDADAVRERRLMLETNAPVAPASWIEQNPLLFGAGVGVAVFLLGVILIAANSQRPGSSSG
jgi:hypothetical protein